MTLPHWPNNFELPPAGLLESIDNSLAQIPADSLMLWLFLDDEEALLSVYNPTLPNLCGFKQPLNRGLISQVLFTGMPLLERHPGRHPFHDPTLDQTHQNKTRAMIAAPLATSEKVIGILSAVQFEPPANPEEFELCHLDFLTKEAARIAPELAPCMT